MSKTKNTATKAATTSTKAKGGRKVPKIAFGHADAAITKRIDQAIKDGLVTLDQGKKLAAISAEEATAYLDKAEGFLRTYLTQESEGGTPDHAAAHWRLGQLFEKQGRKADARKAFETALKLRPQFPEAKKDLERLASRP